MTPISVHPEGPRYARSIVFVPGLWTPGELLRPLASFLAHRGWAGIIVDAASGGVGDRAAQVAALVRTLGAPPVVVGHDAGGLVALAAAQLEPVAAVAWLSPIGPRPRGLTRLLGPWQVAAALLRGRDLVRPTGAAARALFGRSEPTGLGRTEAIALVRDVLRGGAPPAPGGPVALIAATGDALAASASAPGADVLEVPVPERWLIGPTAWQPTAGVLHRWLVRRLGAENLELYEEAMADRESSEDE